MNFIFLTIIYGQKMTEKASVVLVFKRHWCHYQELLRRVQLAFGNGFENRGSGNPTQNYNSETEENTIKQFDNIT